MSDDKDRRPSQKPTQAAIAALPKTAVSVVGAPLIQGELKLSDGTILSIMLVVPAVFRVEGLKNENGSPIYELASQVVMGVKDYERGR